ncbi:hypothetical protein VIN01S_18300 [Vibrio inusitatus NBRC 102082]|uniref:DUF4345 domain-containing protein n=1 Tax=Vibrio inusitatus NBRC 102082 TaxID=1219070 RepID=A0A4Y3HVB2_9VIBR|nr:DUF4345 domain-containing protein [Vibrio inusitatus]GEA51026.1 hypothetical protein VIN01S_18300 [Vibrio inusitatus NBRC 102082]
MKVQSLFLLAASAGLLPIALSYGLVPTQSLSFLFGIDATPVNVSHIFRAVMGLYLALLLFWILGAFRDKYQLAALYSLVVFMLGLAGGRLISFLLDGMPHWLLAIYFALEVAFGVVGIAMIRKTESNI